MKKHAWVEKSLMHRSSLNHAYRLVWSQVRQCLVAIPEIATSRGRGRAVLTTAMLFAAFASPAAWAADLPTGGQIVAGSGSINQSGNTMTVTQDTNAMTANWDSFSIGQGHSVNFVQPSADSVALNRVLGSDVSVIQGALTANGKIFLVNPNGVLFSPSAQVDTGGLVASTLNVKTDDFMAGRYTFEGDSSNAIINEGNIKTAPGGTVALIAAKITNTGTIEAPEGNVLMGAGSKVTLDMGGPVKLEIEKGALDTQIKQGGVIRANGGHVYMTAKAAGELATSVINHTGITEAQTLATGKKGEIILLGDMQKGKTIVSGTLDARAKHGGDGGFIETSAAQVELKDNLEITASSDHGNGGTWLIDPYNYVIDNTAATAISGTLSGGTNVTVDTATNVSGLGSSGNSTDIGDITVSSAILKSGGGAATLTLQAANSIIVDASIGSNTGRLNVVLDADNNSGVRDGAGIILLNNNITTNGGSLSFGTGATQNLNGVMTMLGGDVYVGGNSQINLNTQGGNGAINFYGEVLIANTNGLVVTSGGGNTYFHGIVNSGNSYTGVNSLNVTWAQALSAAQSGTGASNGDTYLATITSRLENAVAGRSVNYQPSWLGGRRVQGIGTNTLWRWIAGPEGLMNNGNGLGFFTQNGSDTTNGAGGTAYNNAYTNWNSGEPNNSGGANMTTGGEPFLQFVGSEGQWNDLPGTSQLNYYVRETNMAPSPLTINNNGGETTFYAAVGGKKALASLQVVGNTHVKGGQITTYNHQNYYGNVLLESASTILEQLNADRDFTLTQNRQIINNHTGDADLVIKTTRGVILQQNTSITSSAHKLNTTLWANSDNTSGGFIEMIQSGGVGATINTHGGNITFSGGSDITTGYAEGSDYIRGNGIMLDNATLNSGGGNIVMRGKSSSIFNGTYSSSDNVNSTNTDGIRLHGSNLIDSGTGTISLTGVAVGTTSSSNGIETNYTGYTRILSAAENTTAISIFGDASTAGTSTNGWGTFLWGTNTSGIVIAATGLNGGISLDGKGRNGMTNGGGLHLEPNAFVLASSGPISLTGTRGSTSTYEDVVVNSTVGYISTLPAGFGIASPVTTSASNITLKADSFSANRVFGGGTFTGSAVQSSGTLTIAPRTNGRDMSVQTANPGSSVLWINPTSLFGSSGLFKTGFSKFVFGDSNTGNVTLNNYTFDNDTEVNSSGNVVLGTLTIANHDLAVNVTGSGTITDTGTLTLSGLKLNGSSAAAALDSTTNSVGTLAAHVASLAFVNSNALAIGTVKSMDGITATGTVDVATLAGDLTVGKNVTTTSTANNAITLNAGKSTAAGTSTGGNIILSGSPVFTTGTNGRTTLYTGSITGSTGLVALAGAGRYRYNSDESATNYSTTTHALGSGLYAVYRERPVITVTANNDSKTADGTSYTGGKGVTYSNTFVNGESLSDITISGLSYTGSSQGATTAGTYVLTPTGLGSGPGYAFNYVSGTLTLVAPVANNLPVEVAQTLTLPPTSQPPYSLPPPATSTVTSTATSVPLQTAGGLEIISVEASGQNTPAESDDGDISVAYVNTPTDNSGFLKVFVVNGGIHLPHGSSSEQ